MHNYTHIICFLWFALQKSLRVLQLVRYVTWTHCVRVPISSCRLLASLVRCLGSVVAIIAEYFSAILFSFTVEMSQPNSIR